MPLYEFTGFTGNYASRNSLSVSFDHEYPRGGELRLLSSLMLNYRGSQNVHTNLDPLFNINTVTRIHLRFGLDGNNWQSAVSLVKPGG